MATYNASGDAVGVDGKKPPRPVAVIGSFMPVVPFKVDGAGASTGNDSISITFPGLKSIHGHLVQAFVTATGATTNDDALLVTVSGNVLTITEGGAGTIETDTYHGLVWGEANLA
jgi:hypothetical protein